MSSQKIDKSPEGYSECVNLFSIPATDTSISGVFFQDFNPISQLSPDANISFSYSGSTNSYIDLKKSSITVKAKILDEAGNPVADQPVALSNLGLHSCFKQCDLSLNQKIISSNVSTNYPYKAMIDTLTQFSEGPKNTILQNSLFIKDIASTNYQDIANIDVNPGFSDRQKTTKNGGIACMSGPLMLDVCQINRYILNGVNIGLTLYQNSDSFRLTTLDGTKYKLHIIECQLRLCLIKLNSAIVLAHSRQLQSSNALYPFLDSDIRVFNIPKGSYQFRIDDIYNANVPSRLIIAMVSSAAYSGSYPHSPFHFKTYNCRRLHFSIDGESRPGPAIQVNNSDFTQAYKTLFENVGHLTSLEGCDISQYDYVRGNFITIFDIDSNHGDYLNLKRQGHTSLEIDFSQPTPENVSIICYAKFWNIFQIDAARNVII